MIFLLLFLFVVVGVGVFAVVRELGGFSRSSGSTSTRSAPFGSTWSSGERGPLGVPHIPRLRELPQGCLIGLIVTGLVWFGLWVVVLVLALRFLSAPLGG